MDRERSATEPQRREGSPSPVLLSPEVQWSLRGLAALLLLSMALLAFREHQVHRFDESRLRIDLNKATIQELTLLPGIGETMATRIVADRTAKGRFQSVADLSRVRGIGERTVAEIKPFCTEIVPEESERVVVAKPPLD